MLGHFFSEHMDERYILKSVVGQPAEGLCVLKRFPDSIILAKPRSFQGHSHTTHGLMETASRAIYTGSMIGVVPPKV
ncbi:hypothetical protein CH63R_11996 [Colletotrichum higginsianum IMI 349063]|uniref:Uncharacterized protein n=1 Tax=Colletotrichum higginsianum (strain IMI 349063) TaxID=759273 RepID=A0A1B7XZW1_COLHI|nr:hypothetical protein CH63R_11996 [Colletotrichum higginsianum IMI 349063]OBR05293.1 hypothetical protein CH63R_11996 [Colletotrichum higginsianum IMI 349063]